VINDSIELMPSRSRVLVYLPEDKLEELKNWAKQENRPVSNLAATIILRALEDKGEEQQPVPSPTPAPKAKRGKAS
jgi:CopG-like RHH_1 or ribbon-helix-helix domain, RHH_5